MNGTVIPEAEIVFTKDNGNGQQEPYLTYKLKDVIVTSYSVGQATDNLGSSGQDGVRSQDGTAGEDDEQPTMTMCTFNFREVRVIYRSKDATAEPNEFTAVDEEAQADQQVDAPADRVTLLR